MSEYAIRAEGVGKKYLIGHETSKADSFRDVLIRAASNFSKAATNMYHGRPMIPGDSVEDFWALRDVNFDIKVGEVVGFVGRNGAGKSTLLKLLSRITEPTEGRITIAGRVGSLLEVGTGFHPELTGRENIYLNGSILGMKQTEIRRKFDEIVDFSGVETFIDTPVKRYSSGMKVRLGFAVAAHLQPEILIVDEVLAVGDAEFQSKCLGKMQDVAGAGRTVLFVSHSMSAVSRLCHRGIMLQKGGIHHDGPINETITQYLDQFRRPLEGQEQKVGNEFVELLDWEVVGANGETLKVLDTTEPFTIRIRVRHHCDLPNVRGVIRVAVPSGEIVFSSTDEARRVAEHGHADAYSSGDTQLEATVPPDVFNTGSYEVMFGMSQPGGRTILQDTLLHRFEAICLETHGSLRNEGARWRGVVVPRVGWRVSRVPPNGS